MADGEYCIVIGVDIVKCVVSLARELEDLPQYMCFPGHPGRICRIPQNLCEVDVTAYEPNFLAVGPYNHGKPRVQQMEKRRHLFLKCVLEQKPEITLKDYLKEISSTEPEARSFYSDIEMGSEKFEQMLLLDSLFVLLLFCGMPESLERMILTSNRIGSEVESMSENVNQIKEDIGIEEPMFINYSENKSRSCSIPMFINYSENKSRSFWSLFAHDLFTLENQIPFFVLQKIHNLAISSSSQQSFLDITFGSDEKMIMPCLQVDDNTVSLLRNLIALEQMKYRSLGLIVITYAVLLLHLVIISEDIKLLRKKGIIQHHLSSDKEMCM